LADGDVGLRRHDNEPKRSGGNGSANGEFDRHVVVLLMVAAIQIRRGSSENSTP
jgi:hypothetical protein